METEYGVVTVERMNDEQANSMAAVLLVIGFVGLSEPTEAPSGARDVLFPEIVMRKKKQPSESQGKGKRLGKSEIQSDNESNPYKQGKKLVFEDSPEELNTVKGSGIVRKG